MKKYQIKPGIFCKDDAGRVYLFLSDHQAVDVMSGQYLFTAEYDVDMKPIVNWAPSIVAWGERGASKDTGDRFQLNVDWIAKTGRKSWNKLYG